MSALDLYDSVHAEDLRIKPTDGTQRPAEWGETFDSAWAQGRLLDQFTNGENARTDALQDHIDDIQRKTGKNIGENIDWSGMAMGGALTSNQLREQVNAEAEKLGQPPLSGDELEQRAVDKSREAANAYAEMGRREKTFGGKVGMLAGGFASAAADPINLLALPIAPETAGVGIFAAAMRWGVVAAGAQAIIEAGGLPYREEVQPGYSTSGAPLVGVAEAFAGGMVLGGGTKALGNLWTRVKTGSWPTSVRDAGNILESNANVSNTNVYPGVAGEAAHRDALTHAIDSILNGEPVDITHIITPELEASSRNVLTRLQGERAIALPVFDERTISLISEEARLRARNAELAAPREGDEVAADRLNRLQAVEQQISTTTDDATLRSLNQRRDQILVDTTPDQLREGAAGFEERRKALAERASIESRLEEIANERARAQAAALSEAPPAMIGQTEPVRAVPFEALRQHAIATTQAAQAERAAITAKPRPELPFEATAAEAQAREVSDAMVNGIRQIAQRAGYDMPAEEANTIANKLVKASPEDSQDMLRNLQVSPRQVAEAPITPREPASEMIPTHTHDEVTQITGTPEHEQALRADIDRDRMLTDRKIPVSVDEHGNVIERSVDEAMAEVDAYKLAADHIQACAAPPSAEEAA